jgi:branched-chain amino acid aminotransferase
LITKGELLTPPIDAGILEGITRNAVIDIAREVGITTREISLTRYDVYVADECFLTGSAAEVIPVVKVDNRAIGAGVPGPITQDLIRRFHELTRR